MTSNALPRFHENAVLFGHDPTPHLIAFELEGDDQIRVFARVGDRVASELRPFSPFALLASTDLLAGWGGGARVDALEGDAFFKYIVFFPGWGDALRARAHFQKVSGKTATAPDAPHLFLNDAVHQYLLLAGQTHFLEMPFAALRRLQLDIETYTTEGFQFPNAAREGDRISVIALTDSTGWEHVISGAALGEAEMLQELTRLIQARDPDVIEGHNLFRFDLEYIQARARRHKVRLGWGRDGSVLAGHPSRMQIAERAITYTKYEVFGRHIVDTWILAQQYDVTSRDLESYGLKDVARAFGVAAPGRTYLPPEKIPWTFDHDPETLCRYALDDVRETQALGAILSQSYFVQAQIFPYSYQNVVLRGNATKIDALLLREHLRQRRSVPRPSEGREVAGGYTDCPYVGIARRVLHCDVASLYPSVMLAFGYFPKADALGIFPALLRDLREFRLKAKALARGGTTEESRTYYDALQTTFKILINSFYGYLGFSLGHWNDFEAANSVTAKGRELITGVLAWLQAREATIIEVDTDGLYFMPPPGVDTPEDEERLMAELAATLPAGITLEMDGRYRAMFSYKMKNYALLDEAGRLTIKGSGLRSRGLEQFQRDWMEEMFRLVLSDRAAEVLALVERYRQRFEKHEVDIADFMKTETLQDSLETYKVKRSAKKRNPGAAYELALKSERRYQPGDQISYYVIGLGKNVKVHEACKLAAEWDKGHPDENVEYYVAKLYDLYEKFRPLIEGGSLTEAPEEARGKHYEKGLFD
jgi:DNA polymerase elongation subunit (family B)